MKALITGGTGFVGSRAREELASRGYDVVVLSRRKSEGPTAGRANGRAVSFARWVGAGDEIPPEALQGASCIVNLAGEPIGDGRWTRKKKARIFESRVATTRALVDAIEKQAERPKVLISGSAVGYYGPRGDEEITESDRHGGDFLASVCRAWEAEASRAEDLGVRVVILRIGVVLGRGGALERMLIPYRLYLGGPLGAGEQWFSWIHLDDLARLIAFAAESEYLRGPVNATSPNPLKMRQFSKALGKALGKPSWLPVPGFALRLAFGEMAEMLLTGQRVLPKKALEAGYEFLYPTIEGALGEIFADNAR